MQLDISDLINIILWDHFHSIIPHTETAIIHYCPLLPIKSVTVVIHPHFFTSNSKDQCPTEVEGASQCCCAHSPSYSAEMA